MISGQVHCILLSSQYGSINKTRLKKIRLEDYYYSTRTLVLVDRWEGSGLDIEESDVVHILSFDVFLFWVQLYCLFRLMVFHHVFLPGRNLVGFPFFIGHHCLLQHYIVSHGNQPQNLSSLNSVRRSEVPVLHNNFSSFRLFSAFEFSFQARCVGVVLWVDDVLLEKSKK